MKTALEWYQPRMTVKNESIRHKSKTTDSYLQKEINTLSSQNLWFLMIDKTN